MYDLPDLQFATYSFPKFKFRQYKSTKPFDEHNNQIIVSEDECDFMNFLTIATVSETELMQYLESVAPSEVMRDVIYMYAYQMSYLSVLTLAKYYPFIRSSFYFL